MCTSNVCEEQRSFYSDKEQGNAHEILGFPKTKWNLGNLPWERESKPATCRLVLNVPTAYGLIP